MHNRVAAIKMTPTAQLSHGGSHKAVSSLTTTRRQCCGRPPPPLLTARQIEVMLTGP